MKLDFVKLSPTQNMTILVSTPVTRSLHVSVAEQLMAYDSLQAEQVGFLEKPSLPGARIRLQMMGGEFCGNASMALGAYLAFQEKLADGASADYPLEISGAEGIVNCHILREENHFLGTVAMPLPTAIREIGFANGFSCSVVFLPGIAHAIVDAAQMTPAEADNCIAGWCQETGQEAFGVILCSDNAIRPLVYVHETNTAVWEKGCGSGTAALAAYEADRRKHSVSLEISQPGGVICADAAYENGVSEIKITGKIKIAAMGQAWV